MGDVIDDSLLWLYRVGECYCCLEWENVIAV